jgi:tRNA(fMet)-specific endonuclease VapC
MLLDTDHLSVLLQSHDRRYATLTSRIRGEQGERLGVSIVSVEEVLRGWLAQVRKANSLDGQVYAYGNLAKAVEALGNWEIVRFDEQAGQMFRHLRKERVRIGTQDLKIASIALVRNEMLLTANYRDFRLVPGLQFQNWLK